MVKNPKFNKLNARTKASLRRMTKAAEKRTGKAVDFGPTKDTLKALGVTGKRATMAIVDDPAIASDMEICERCTEFKQCALYTLQHGETAWVCKECRNGTSEAQA